jgi:hypothetical protein
MQHHTSATEIAFQRSIGLLLEGTFMTSSSFRSLFLAVLLVPNLVGTQAAAQETNHQHYEKPKEASPPGPGGILAPRLQNLGAALGIQGKTLVADPTRLPGYCDATFNYLKSLGFPLI